MSVYVLIAPSVGRIKIGLTNQFGRRFSLTSHWSPVALTVHGVDEDGDMLTEKELHWRFRKSNSHSDWYHITSDVSGFLREFKNGKIPGGWYLPNENRQKHETVSNIGGARYSVIEKRLGLTRKDLFNITGVKGNLHYPDYAGLPIKQIPQIVDHLRSKKINVHPWDFISTPRPYEIPREELRPDLFKRPTPAREGV